MGRCQNADDPQPPVKPRGDRRALADGARGVTHRGLFDGTRRRMPSLARPKFHCRSRGRLPRTLVREHRMAELAKTGGGHRFRQPVATATPAAPAITPASASGHEAARLRLRQAVAPAAVTAHLDRARHAHTRCASIRRQEARRASTSLPTRLGRSDDPSIRSGASSWTRSPLEQATTAIGRRTIARFSTPTPPGRRSHAAPARLEAALWDHHRDDAGDRLGSLRRIGADPATGVGLRRLPRPISPRATRAEAERSSRRLARRFHVRRSRSAGFLARFKGALLTPADQKCADWIASSWSDLDGPARCLAATFSYGGAIPLLSALPAKEGAGAARLSQGLQQAQEA